MLDAICLFDEELPVTYSVFKFQKLSDSEIERYRQTLICPACAGKAYYRKAAKDGKAACFGSRYHQADCREFKPSAAKEREEQDAIEVNQQLLDSDAMVIDFSRAPSVKKIPPNRQRKLSAKGLTAKQAAQIVDPNAAEGIAKQETNSDQSHKDKRIASQGLQKLLHSLIRGSDLATSDLWVYTDDKYRWRAKNLFVNFSDAKPTDNGAPRMYWGTISHTDKERLWLNPADTKDVGIPIDKIVSSLEPRFGLRQRRDFEGAGIILFGKCFWNKTKTRKIIQLWNNDISRMYISKADEEEVE